MSFTYFNELLKENQIAANQTPITAGEKPYMDRLDNVITNAVNHGVEPDYIYKLTMLVCLVVKKGVSVDAIDNRKIINYVQTHPLELTDDYIDNVVNMLKND
jgi:hypothetical protein